MRNDNVIDHGGGHSVAEAHCDRRAQRHGTSIQNARKRRSGDRRRRCCRRARRSRCCRAIRARRAPYAVRLKFPANYAIPAHSHPTDENVVVVSGALTLGMGDKLVKTPAAGTRR